jgi:signal transduction histidine kinase
MAVLLAAIAAVLYVSVGRVLLDEIDAGLRSRAATVGTAVPNDADFSSPARGLVEPDENFAQVLRADGSVVASSTTMRAPVLEPAAARGLTRPRFFQRDLPVDNDPIRLLATPVTRDGTRYVVIVGTSTSDRSDALRMIPLLFLIGGPIALALVSTVGWIVAGAALRPVERMRRQAAAISSSRDEHRLTVPEPEDEFRRLALTLNSMLDRLDAASRAERAFLDNASHELRTPLTALKAELDLARARPRSPGELLAALESASEETDRLARLADDLLVLSRTRNGAFVVERRPLSLRALLDASVDLFRARAAAAGVTIGVPPTRWLTSTAAACAKPSTTSSRTRSVPRGRRSSCAAP